MDVRLREVEVEGRAVAQPILGLELSGERAADHLGDRGGVVDGLAVRDLAVVDVGEAESAAVDHLVRCG